MWREYIHRSVMACVCVCVWAHARSVVSDTFGLWEFITNKKPDFTIGWEWTQEQNEDKIVLSVSSLSRVQLFQSSGR